ncbi:MAG: hypothetical protein GY903_27865 [Fuerstiella sp.]|nr:hypothetical protein [Fuerstiella sp.]MCP4858313.1 hypothetical protein [Fuerstiella sp.]
MRVVVLLLLFSMYTGSISIAQDADRSGGRDRSSERGQRRGGRGDTSDSVIESGYVFIDGHYIRIPYQIQYSDSEVSINESTFELSVFEGWLNEKKKRNGGSDDRGRRVHRNLRDMLEGDGSLVLFDGEPSQVFNMSASYDLLSVLVNADSREAFGNGEREWLPTGVDQQSWVRWIGEFKCPEELRERADSFLTKIEELESTNDAQQSARRMLESSAYPLTVVGMLLVVMAFGHLLSFKPDSDAVKSLETQRAVGRSLTLLVALSALDLIWTLLVSRAGDMKELNPLGAAFIDNPVALILLKTVATLTAVVLLFVLRQHHVAQKGAWWGCLICTLLTVRWLTFNSMFT